MKVIIDIPETEFNHIKKVWSKRRGSIPYTNVAFGTPVPDNVTNGDMIKAMFPNARVSEIFPICNCDEVYYVPIEKVDGVTNEMRVMKSWWNAPYKAESEEK